MIDDSLLGNVVYLMDEVYGVAGFAVVVFSQTFAGPGLLADGRLSNDLVHHRGGRIPSIDRRRPCRGLMLWSRIQLHVDQSRSGRRGRHRRVLRFILFREAADSQWTVDLALDAPVAFVGCRASTLLIEWCRSPAQSGHSER